MAKNIELIDFWAPWCGPCRSMTTVMEEIEKEYGDKIKITKYNIDESDEAAKYNVMSIPTFLILKDGKIVNQITGAQPKSVITKVIEEALK